MIKVYIASKIIYAPQFKGYREAWAAEGIEICSRWIDKVDLERDATPDIYQMMWLIDEEDVRACKALILFGDSRDKLRGALIEAGMAIAQGKQVFTVGKHPDYGSWQHHPLVTPVNSFEHAKLLIKMRFT
jgi:hypothetical protein